MGTAQLGRYRPGALRPGVPAGLPADGELLRRGGPHPGGLRPGLPLAVQLHAGTFEGWLHRITTNLFLDAARRKQRIRWEGLGDETEKLPGNEQTPAQAFDDRHFEGDVQAALMSLPPDYRAAVALCDIEGFSYEEIAATLGVKLGTVRSRIHRGRAQLREALAHREPTHGKAGHGKGGES